MTNTKLDTVPRLDSPQAKKRGRMDEDIREYGQWFADVTASGLHEKAKNIIDIKIKVDEFRQMLVEYGNEFLLPANEPQVPDPSKITRTLTETREFG